MQEYMLETATTALNSRDYTGVPGQECLVSARGSRTVQVRLDIPCHGCGGSTFVEYWIEDGTLAGRAQTSRCGYGFDAQEAHDRNLAQYEKQQHALYNDDDD